MAESNGAHQKLAAWMAKRGLGPGDLANAVGVTYVAALLWRNGKRNPSAGFQRDIRVWTGGHVKEKDWPKQSERFQRRKRVVPFRDKAAANSR